MKPSPDPHANCTSLGAAESAPALRAVELNTWLHSLHPVGEPSVDRVIAGDPETVARGLAVVWMPTWAALREARALGCNVVVAHEPTFFSHFDLDGFEGGEADLRPGHQAMCETRQAKLRWIEENGLVVIRCHDVLDQMPGGVVDSLVAKLGFAESAVELRAPSYRIVRIDPPQRALELAQRLAKAFARIGQPGVAFYGDPDRHVARLGLGTGYSCEPGRFLELGAQMCVTIDDRIKTWVETEWADDSGYPMIVIHHGTAEEWGVHTLHQLLASRYPALPVKLIPQGFRARWVPALG